MNNQFIYIVVITTCSWLSSYGQYTQVPDNVFEQHLIDQGIDTEGILDGQVLTDDIANVITLNVSPESQEFPLIQDLTGIEDFIDLDSLEKIAVSTELTFSDNLSNIVNEVKFLLRRDIDAGVLGVNTSDPQPNEISDTDALNLAKTTGAKIVVEACALCAVPKASFTYTSPSFANFSANAASPFSSSL